MQQYTIITDIQEERSFSTMDEISLELQRLQREEGTFVILNASQPVNKVNYIQAMNHCHEKGFFKKSFVELYNIEVNTTESDGGNKQYSYTVGSFEDVRSIFSEFISLGKTPDVSGWDDITETIFG